MTTDQLARKMLAEVQNGRNTASGRLEPLGVQFTLTRNDDHVVLTMEREDVGYPLAHEIEYARRAFGVPEGAEPRYSRPWRTRPRTNRRTQVYAVEFTYYQFSQ